MKTLFEKMRDNRVKLERFNTPKYTYDPKSILTWGELHTMSPLTPVARSVSVGERLVKFAYVD
jgi:hypothetical protein